MQPLIHRQNRQPNRGFRQNRQPFPTRASHNKRIAAKTATAANGFAVGLRPAMSGISLHSPTAIPCCRTPAESATAAHKIEIPAKTALLLPSSISVLLRALRDLCGKTLHSGKNGNRQSLILW